MAAAIPPEDRELEPQLDDVVDALRRRGPLSRPPLAREVNARLWGPGRLRHVLRVARQEQLLRRVGRYRWNTA